ncbi:glycoside hydrolase family 81 protein [Ophiocordyceps camponoti-floridani]|uniref:glucan endo-1,3-beta-D-glucosidase n=1 Tax=Ophiocordyceps camponoti-floridani TaxID=2030778 RepID=A0A8H4QDS2_9HYPO|nr:glycoside hydrolase family 81 protein [Ophiocordyceps camponoti-floridani]
MLLDSCRLLWLVLLLTGGAQASAIRSSSLEAASQIAQEQLLFADSNLWNRTLPTAGGPLPQHRGARLASVNGFDPIASQVLKGLRQSKIRTVEQTLSLPRANRHCGNTKTSSANLTPSSSKTSLKTVDIAKAPPQPETYLNGYIMGADHDIFAKPIDLKALPDVIARRQDHPVPRKGIKSRGPLQTNKFYANFFLGDQLGPIYTFPYSLQWTGGKGKTVSYGMSVSHVDAHQQVFGGKERVKGASSFYINPIGIQSLIISAMELGGQTTLTTDSLTPHSVRAHLSKDGQSAPAVSFPLVQGMACVTAQFEGTKPLLQSGVSFKTVTRVTREPKKGVVKYNFVLADGTTWRVYGWHTKGEGLELAVANDGRAESKRPFTGVLQVCKDPMTEGSEAALDDGAGVFAEKVGLSGWASGKSGRYRLRFERGGHKDGQLNMYALPHHVESFDAATRKLVRSKVQLQTTTKGVATLVCGNEWTLEEAAMPIDMGFAPWHPERGSVDKLSAEAKRTIRAAAGRELGQDMASQSNIDSMYFSGKALAKFASAVWVVQRMVGDAELAQTGLRRLQSAFATFAGNRQRFPLTYESAWGGVVSRASYDTGDGGVDFGNTLYNDHHFHYGYHILAAALIADLDPGWGRTNGDYVRTLVRDIANPSASDGLFPEWRSFDWFHGHSWAHGLYASMDGKNQESSSEDMMAAYALKMWGRVSGDGDLEARSNLQLAVLARSLRAYYLYEADNSVQPRRFIGNKVAGILFENKVDHTTFFDGSLEAIQGIHMIPILPPTAFVRRPRFVAEEWETYFSRGRIDSVGNAWKSIIYASYATVDPVAAFKFFSSPSFQPQWLDGGASLTWFMAYAAALGGL